jgi:hypothetical protein
MILKMPRMPEREDPLAGSPFDNGLGVDSVDQESGKRRFGWKANSVGGSLLRVTGAGIAGGIRAISLIPGTIEEGMGKLKALPGLGNGTVKGVGHCYETGPGDDGGSPSIARRYGQEMAGARLREAEEARRKSKG